MRKFYLQFQNVYALRKELSWTHYRSLIRVENPKAREVYSILSDNEQLLATKYKLYIPTEEELINEIAQIRSLMSGE